MFYNNGDYVVELNIDGLCCESGKMTWKNGDVYKGKQKANTKDGQGTFYWKHGIGYECEWKAVTFCCNGCALKTFRVMMSRDVYNVANALVKYANN